MANLTMTTTIQGDIAKVFDHFSDFENAAERISGITRIEMLSKGPVGVGTRFRETRVMFKREATEEMEVTAFEPGKSYTVNAHSCGSDFSTTFKFSSEGSGTRVDMDLVFRPVTFMAKVMSPIGKLMMGPMRKCVQQDFDDLQKAIES